MLIKDYLRNELNATFIPQYNFISYAFKDRKFKNVGVVLCALINMQITDDEWFQTTDSYLMEQTQLSINTVREALMQLEYFGYIEKDASSTYGTYIKINADRLKMAFDKYNEHKILKNNEKIPEHLKN